MTARQPALSAIDDVVRQIAARSAAVTVSDARQQLARLAKTAYAVTQHAQAPLEHLNDIVGLQWQLDQARQQLVQAAYAEGATWGQIGRALGISRQAARERHMHLVDGSDRN